MTNYNIKTKNHYIVLITCHWTFSIITFFYWWDLTYISQWLSFFIYGLVWGLFETQHPKCLYSNATIEIQMVHRGEDKINCFCHKWERNVTQHNQILECEAETRSGFLKCACEYILNKQVGVTVPALNSKKLTIMNHPFSPLHWYTGTL